MEFHIETADAYDIDRDFFSLIELGMCVYVIEPCLLSALRWNRNQTICASARQSQAERVQFK